MDANGANLTTLVATAADERNPDWQPGVSFSGVDHGVVNPAGSVVTADFNNDGCPDLAVGHVDLFREVDILYGGCDGDFGTPNFVTVGLEPYAMATADFDDNGCPDFVTANRGSDDISVGLGDCTGGFQVTNIPVGHQPDGIAAANVSYVDAENVPDIIVSNGGSNTVSVLLNNGNGTFQAPVNTSVPCPGELAADFLDDDYYQDVAVVNTCSAQVTYLGSGGTGGFIYDHAFPVGSNPDAIVTGDYNGDGVDDVAVGNFGGKSVSMLINDGTGGVFESSTTSTPHEPVAIAADDFNADGNLDLAITGTNSNTVNVLLGNGVGGLFPLPDSPGGCTPLALVSGDFDGDGLPDLASADDCGQGLFAMHNTTPAIIPNSLLPQTITFNALPNHPLSDPDFAVTTTASSGLPVYLEASGPCAFVDVNKLHLMGVGTCTVTASQPGDSTYDAAPDVQRSFQISKGSQTITFPAIPAHTLGDPDFNVNATASSGLPVSFSLVSGPCTVTSAGLVHLTGGGTCSIRASQAGDSNWNSAPNVTKSFVVKLNQTINFPAIPTHAFGDPDFTVSATATSGLTVKFARVDGPCKVTSAGSVHLNGAGTCAVKATQAGNASYNAAPPVQQSFAISKQNQAITFPVIPDHHLGDPDFLITATSSSGLKVSFAWFSGPCSVKKGKVHLTGRGTCTIRAFQAGNASYNPAPDKTRSFAIT
jgi:hypothetical protein